MKGGLVDNEITGKKIVVRQSNFKKFREVFTPYKSLEFENRFPVKFFKVKTNYQ